MVSKGLLVRVSKTQGAIAGDQGAMGATGAILDITETDMLEGKAGMKLGRKERTKYLYLPQRTGRQPQELPNGSVESSIFSAKLV